MNKEQEFVVSLQGKALREYAQKLVNSSYRIEQKSLNRYRVYAGQGEDYTLINRRSFVLLDKELYKLQARENKLSFAIEKALDNDALTFCIDKASIEAMPVKLLYRTLSTAKVALESVTINTTGNCYLLTIALVKSVSERDLTKNETELAAMFQRANESANAIANAGNPETEKTAETLVLPPAENTVVDTTATEVIPAK